MIKFKSFLSIAIMIIAGLALSSCNEEPTSLGYSLIKDTIGLYTISETNPAIKIAGSSYLKYNRYINSANLMLGKSGNKKAAIFMGFASIPDTLGFVTEADIVESFVTMYPLRYAVGDSTAANALSFNIYDIKQRWEVTLTPEDAFANSGFKGPQIGTYTGNVKLKDTLDTLRVDIAKNLPVSWFTKKPNPKDTVWGMAFYPNDNSTVINQFCGNMANYINRTRLTVIYKNKNRNYGLDTIVMFTGLDKTIPLFETADTKSITVRGGYIQHGLLDLDLSYLPIFAGIHLAELELTLDKSKSSNGNYLLDSALKIDYFRSSDGDVTDATEAGYDYAILKTGTTDKYRTTGLSGIIADIVKRGGKGALTLRVASLPDEIGKAQTMVFYGSDDPVVDRRPKLKIIYSIQQEKNKK